MTARSSNWILHFDGLCEPRNPGGVMAWGWTLDRPDVELLTGKGAALPAPENTNNVAEWLALGYGLKAVLEEVRRRGVPPDRLTIRGDSQLVINQLTGRFQVKAAHLIGYRNRCIQILDQIDPLPGMWKGEWIPREQNAAADELSRQGYFELTGRPAPERAGRGTQHV